MATVSLERSSGSVAGRLRRWCANFVGGLAFVLIAAGVVRPAAAIWIVGHYIDDAIQSQGGENPDWDPGGHILQAHFEAAQEIWEDLLFDEFKWYHINYEWDDNIGGLGLWTPTEPTANNLIEIHPNKTWFYDSPNEHEDFNFTNPATADPRHQGQTLYRNLSSGNQATLFPDTTPPTVLEVGFRGDADAVPGGSPAQGAHDLLSVLVHEIGHELGISWLEPGEYDLNPAHVGGLQDVTVKESPQECCDWGHLADGNSTGWAMGQDGLPEGVRILPSATDVLAIAKDQDISHVYLARVDRISSGSWQSSQGWIGGSVPNELQGPGWFSPDVFVRHGGTVSLGANTKVKSLLIDWGSTVGTQNHTLTVTGGPTIVYLASQLRVDANGHVELHQLDLNDGGTLTLFGGTAKVWEGLNMNLSGGFPNTIQGHGYVEVALPLLNNGVIRADGGTLSFGYGGFDPTPLDLDGNVSLEYGKVQAIDGDLFFAAGLTDEFDGQMWVTEGRTITMAYGGDWTLGPDGILNFGTNPPYLVPATLDGSQGSRTIVRGNINVNGLAVIDTMVAFEPTADVEIDTLADRLLLNGVSTTYRGGSYTGGGTLEQRGPASVEEDTQIDVLFYDFDGDEANPSTTAISPYKTFTINSHYVELFAENDYDGIIVNNGGKLKVYTMTYDEQVMGFVPAPWKIDQDAYLYLTNGKIPMEIPTGPGAQVHGSPLIVAGHVVVSGEDNVIASGKDKDNNLIPGLAVTFQTTADVQVSEEEDELYLYFLTEYQGGSYTGDGTIHQVGDANFVDDTAIKVDTYDWDGFENSPSTTSIVSGVTVFLHNRQIDVGVDGYDGLIQIHQGTLIVNTWEPWGQLTVPVPWRLDPDGSLKLFDAAVVSGSPNMNTPSYTGGSTMLVSGSIYAWGPGNRIYSPVVFEPSATVTLAPDAYLYLHSNTTYQGGSFNGQGTFTQTGDAVVQQPVGIYVYRFDMDGGTETTTWTLEDNLLINADRLDLYDSIFDGTINVLDDATLTVNLPAGDGWEMDGWLAVGNAAQSATFHLYGARVKIDGFVDIGPNSLAVFHSHVSGVADFPDDGSVQFLGGYSPGASAAVVQFGGNVLFGPDGTLSMEIADTEHTDRNPGYDQLVIERDLSMGGTLDLIFIDGFAPKTGDTFDLLHVSGTTQGSFSENILNLQPGFEYKAGWEEGVFRLTALNDAVFVPEPSSLVLGAIGLLGLLAYAWRKRRIG